MVSKLRDPRIYDLVDYSKTGTVKDGIPVNYSLKPVTIPQLEEIYKKCTYKLTLKGYSVKRVAPKMANVIIRVFRKEGLNYGEEKLWCFGAQAFICSPLVKVFFSKKLKLLNYQTHKFPFWVCENETVTIYPDFVDYYCAISVCE